MKVCSILNRAQLGVSHPQTPVEFILQNEEVGRS